LAPTLIGRSSSCAQYTIGLPQVDDWRSFPVTSSQPFSLSLDPHNDSFWREYAVQNVDDSNHLSQPWLSCGNKLGPGQPAMQQRTPQRIGALRRSNHLMRMVGDGHRTQDSRAVSYGTATPPIPPSTVAAQLTSSSNLSQLSPTDQGFWAIACTRTRLAFPVFPGSPCLHGAWIGRDLIHSPDLFRGGTRR